MFIEIQRWFIENINHAKLRFDQWAIFNINPTNVSHKKIAALSSSWHQHRHHLIHNTKTGFSRKSWSTAAELMQRPFQNQRPYFRNVILDAYILEQLESPESRSWVFYYSVIKVSKVCGFWTIAHMFCVNSKTGRQLCVVLLFRNFTSFPLLFLDGKSLSAGNLLLLLVQQNSSSRQ